MIQFLALCGLLCGICSAQASPLQSVLDDQHTHSLATDESAVGAFANPAAAGFDPEVARFGYFGSIEESGESRAEDWAFYSKLGGLVFGVKHRESGSQFLNQYRLGMGFGDREHQSGFAYVWNRGNLPNGQGPDEFLLSSLDRFAPFGRQMPQFSLGLVHHFILGKANNALSKDFHGNRYWGEGGIAVRPLPAVRGLGSLSLSADASWDRNAEFHGDRVWLGAQWSPLNYLSLSAKQNVNLEDFAFSADLQLGGLGVGILSSESELSQTSTGSNMTNNMMHVELSSALFNQPPRFRAARKTYAHLKLDGMAGEYSWLISGDKFRLPDFLEQMDAIQEDPRVKGVFIDRRPGFSADPTLLWEIRRRLQEFKDSGREIVYYSHNLKLFDLYLASVADRRAILPTGAAEIILPMGGERLYFKSALERAGIEFSRWNVGAWKGAGEPFAADRMSDEVRENVGRVFRELREHIDATIAEGYGLSDTQMNELMGSYFLNEDRLQELGIIDTMLYNDRVKAWVCNRLDEDEEEEGEGLKISFGDEGGDHLVSIRALTPEYTRREWMDDREIAVIYASGPIRAGSSIGPFVIGHKTVIKQLKAARKNDRIQAVVLHIDSPGGSGYASDLVWREMQLLKEEKPLIVTQGFLAASGGYYFSMSGDEILTSPLTITGSIGVAAGAFFDKGLMEKSGFRQDGVWAGKQPLGGAALPFGLNLQAGEAEMRLPTIPVMGRPLNEQQDREIRGLIRHYYDDFVDKVAEGRELEWEQVHAMAEGRVWSGPTAIEKDLADSIGGLEEAIEEARRQAELPADAKVQEYFPEFSLAQFFELFWGMATLQLDETRAEMAADAMQTAEDEQLKLLGTARPEVLFDYFLFSPQKSFE